MKLFTNLKDIDWVRLTKFVGLAIVFWMGLLTIMPESWYKIGLTILMALQNATFYAMNARKEGLKTRVDDGARIESPLEKPPLAP